MTAGRDAVYLAGPAVFRPDAAAIGLSLKAMCAAQGLEALWPLDNKIDPHDLTPPARQLFNGNVAMIKRARAVVADISPFRGPHMDCRTAAEIGRAGAWCKPVFAYTDCLHEGTRAARPMIERIQCQRARDGQLRDLQGSMQVEDFGLAENLMIACDIEPDVAPSAAIAIMRCARHLRYLRQRAMEPA
jgi:nucleoside 2-deoxyribosyltransferase